MARANSGNHGAMPGREKLFLPSHGAGPRMAKRCLGLTFAHSFAGVDQFGKLPARDCPIDLGRKFR
jgi:hypothetical protein